MPELNQSSMQFNNAIWKIVRELSDKDAKYVLVEIVKSLTGNLEALKDRAETPDTVRVAALSAGRRKYREQLQLRLAMTADVGDGMKETANDGE